MILELISKKLIILIMVLAMAEIAYAPLGDKSYQIGINQNDSMYELYHNYSGEYKSFFVDKGGILVSNFQNQTIIKQKICISTYCTDSLSLSWSDKTDNLTYAWINGTNNPPFMKLQDKYNLNTTDERVKVNFMVKNNGFITLNALNLSYVHYNSTLGNDTFVIIDKKYYNLSKNKEINAVNKYLKNDTL